MLGAQTELKKNQCCPIKTQDQQTKCAKSTTIYNNVGQKTDKNAKLHQESEANITSFVKKANSENKRKE